MELAPRALAVPGANAPLARRALSGTRKVWSERSNFLARCRLAYPARAPRSRSRDQPPSSQSLSKSPRGRPCSVATSGPQLASLLAPDRILRSEQEAEREVWGYPETLYSSYAFHSTPPLQSPGKKPPPACHSRRRSCPSGLLGQSHGCHVEGDPGRAPWRPGAPLTPSRAWERASPSVPGRGLGLRQEVRCLQPL